MAELREEAGLTQAEVAERTGMNVTNYQRIEHGRQNVTVEMIVRVANALGVKAGELFVPGESSKTRRPGRPRKASR
jgi:transcriptional regulator with XRE-family HTH domain